MKTIAVSILGGCAMLAEAYTIANAPNHVGAITAFAVVALLCFMTVASAKE